MLGLLVLFVFVHSISGFRLIPTLKSKSPLHAVTITTSDDIASSSDSDDNVNQLGLTFVNAVNDAFSTGSTSNLDVLLENSGSMKWDNNVCDTYKEMKDLFDGFSDFFLDPYVMSYDINMNEKTNAMEIDYQMSFTYPLPWRPRVIIPGKASLSMNTELSKITSISEKWDITPTKIFLNQVYEFHFFPHK